MYRHENNECKCKKYARAYILPQKYENLFSCKEGFCRGTIFKDLYNPYDEKKEINARGDIKYE
ncbi:spore coat associated protein CotJA [uncultured Clostridium sp.]|uniref:spore coat associated protein CotJA n=1 Tax=uncultured Clostridium sp. TaxID=59620 RepID=UPI0025F22EE9|nr:spore coat associated protein CotJA [uncultured Clostridium sp.]